MEGWRVAVFCSFLLQICSALVVLDCVVTRNGNRIFYNILSQPYPVGAQCEYIWANGKTPLADEDNKTIQVVRHSSSSLETSECLADVFWTQECSQRTALIYYSANCSTTCASQNSLHGDNPTPDPRDEEGQSNIGIRAIIGIAVLLGLIVLIGLIIFLLVRYNESIPRMRSCFLIGRLYSAVRRENDDPGQLDV